jgi:cell wall-associated NlpC family hydrolase
MRTCSAVVCSIAIAGAGASEALANGPGGAVAVTPSPTTTTPTAKTAPTPHAPITAKTSNVTYKGPVYEKTATGEIVAYTPPSKTSTVGTAASSTGGIAAASSEPTELATTIPTELTTGDGMTSATGPTVRPELLVPGTTARFVDGLAAAPMGVPAVVQEIIWAGNEVIGLPYIYGGGHGSFISPGYDCSGTVSFALHGADLLAAPEDSGEMEALGARGVGRWVTIFANGGHAYMTVAGLRLDTSPAEDPANLEGPRWRPLRQTNAGFVVRHPVGL